MLKLGHSLLVLSLMALPFAACTSSADLGGADPDAGGGANVDASASADGNVNGNTADGGGSLDTGTTTDPNDGGACGTLPSYPGMVVPGGTLAARPSGTALRVDLVYQASRVAIKTVSGLTQTLPPSVGPLVAGTNSGYWFELRSATDATLDTRTIQDPTTQEAPGPDGGFMNSVIPMCTEKLLEVEVPNNPSAKSLVLFASPYGTQLAASEIARFHLP